jgi:hypothetical protein
MKIELEAEDKRRAAEHFMKQQDSFLYNHEFWKIIKSAKEDTYRVTLEDIWDKLSLTLQMEISLICAENKVRELRRKYMAYLSGVKDD